MNLMRNLYFLITKALELPNKIKAIDGQLMILLAFIFWVGVVMISAGETDLLPWYRYPAFPFLTILGTWGLQLLVKNANLITTFLAAGLLLGNRMLLVNAFRPNISPIAYRQVMGILLLPSILNTIFHTELLQRISKFIIITIIIIGLYINSVYIYSEYEIVCQSVDCPLIPTTPLSTLYFPFIWRLFDISSKSIPFIP